jgi:hypothetical protein
VRSGTAGVREQKSATESTTDWVRNAQVAIARDQDVVRLDVSVNNPVRVECFDCQRDLDRDIVQPIGRQSPSPASQRSAREVRHGVPRTWRFEVFAQNGHKPPSGFGENAGFALEPHPYVWKMSVTQKLHCDGLPGIRALTNVHVGAAARAPQFETHCPKDHLTRLPLLA